MSSFMSIELGDVEKAILVQDPKIGVAKLKILIALWPGAWVPGKEIYKLIQQTYYDRRIRELKEFGWDIETDETNLNYCLKSHTKKDGRIRTYPNSKLKNELKKRDGNVCKICNSEDKNIQFDHKIPHQRGGATTLNNMQILCRHCNIEKRGACANCQDVSCEKCGYAYPEKYTQRTVVLWDKEVYEKLLEKADANRLNIGELVKKIVNDALF